MQKLLLLTVFARVLLLVAETSAFLPSTSRARTSVSSTELAFGIPSFLTPKQEEEEETPKTAKKKKNQKAGKKGEVEEKKIGKASFFQLLTAGLGAPFLGEFEGVDKETGSFMFSLEANNFVDKEGKSKQTQMPYFENGWVDPEEEAKARKRKEEGFKFPWQN